MFQVKDSIKSILFKIADALCIHATICDLLLFILLLLLFIIIIFYYLLLLWIIHGFLVESQERSPQGNSINFSFQHLTCLVFYLEVIKNFSERWLSLFTYSYNVIIWGINDRVCSFFFAIAKGNRFGNGLIVNIRKNLLQIIKPRFVDHHSTARNRLFKGIINWLVRLLSFQIGFEFRLLTISI